MKRSRRNGKGEKHEFQRLFLALAGGHQRKKKSLGATEGGGQYPTRKGKKKIKSGDLLSRKIEAIKKIAEKNGAALERVSEFVRK